MKYYQSNDEIIYFYSTVHKSIFQNKEIFHNIWAMFSKNFSFLWNSSLRFKKCVYFIFSKVCNGSIIKIIKFQLRKPRFLKRLNELWNGEFWHRGKTKRGIGKTRLGNCDVYMNEKRGDTKHRLILCKVSMPWFTF